jgi:hypothetical protein
MSAAERDRIAGPATRRILSLAQQRCVAAVKITRPKRSGKPISFIINKTKFKITEKSTFIITGLRFY